MTLTRLVPNPDACEVVWFALPTGAGLYFGSTHSDKRVSKKEALSDIFRIVTPVAVTACFHPPRPSTRRSSSQSRSIPSPEGAGF